MVWSSSGTHAVPPLRRGAAAQWADEHGWHYDPDVVVPRSGRDVLRTVLGGVAVTSYTTTAAPDLTSDVAVAPRHAVLATVPADFPWLVVLPEALTRRPGAAPFAPDIQFESAEFNARWRVHCADATFAHAFCHPRVMERLMRADAAGVSVLVEGRDIVVHAPGPTALDAVEARAALGADLARLVPPYLVARYPAPTRRKRNVAAGGDRFIWAFLFWLMASSVGVGVAIALFARAMVLAARSERRRELAERRVRVDGERPPSSPATRRPWGDA